MAQDNSTQSNEILKPKYDAWKLYEQAYPKATAGSKHMASNMPAFLDLIWMEGYKAAIEEKNNKTSK